MTFFPNVTILILIDGFLQCNTLFIDVFKYRCHNPYFNRWFSAILNKMIDINNLKVSQSLF